MKNERKIIVKFVETDKPLDITPIAQAIANAIRKESLNNEQQGNSQKSIKRNTTNQ